MWGAISWPGHLGAGCTSYAIVQVQNKLELPGLLSECKDFIVVNGVTDLSKYSKLQWKSMVDRIIQLMNKDDILNMMKKPYKKISYQEHSKYSLI